MNLEVNRSGYLKTWLGRFAIWTEATFGLYNDLTSALELAPHSKEGMAEEALILFDVLIKSEKDEKYGVLFSNRLRASMINCLRLMRPGTSIPMMDPYQRMISDVLGVKIAMCTTNPETGNEDLCYYSSEGREYNIFTSQFKRRGSEERFRDFVIFEFLIHLI